MTSKSQKQEFPKDSVLSKPRSKPTGAYRKLRRKLALTGLRKPLVWWRHRGFRPADIFFGSYPRSGTTWSRFIIFEILTGIEGGFDEVNGMLHGVGNAATGARLLPGGGRLLATHEPYSKYYHKAVYLVRDVRDVILSEYAYITALEFFDGNLDKFITASMNGKVNPFGAWQNHVNSWLDSPLAGTPNLLQVHFEELRQRPLEGFTQIAEFLGVNASPALIQRAIDNNSLDRMKEKERIAPQRVSVKGQFVRTGAVQGWRSKLSAEQVQVIEKYAGGTLRRLGYPLSTDIAKAEPVFQNVSSQTLAR